MVRELRVRERGQGWRGAGGGLAQLRQGGVAAVVDDDAQGRRAVQRQCVVVVMVAMPVPVPVPMPVPVPVPVVVAVAVVVGVGRAVLVPR